MARVFVPATVGNVAAGFDVLGLAVEGLGDEVTVELIDGPSRVDSVEGRDAEQVPRDPAANCAAVAALSWLTRVGDGRGVVVSLTRRLPVAGGLGSSAAASVGGALAACLARGGSRPDDSQILAAALDGEERVAGRHLDNIAPAYYGGLCIVLSSDPPRIVRAPVRGEWWITLVSPAARLPTKKARSVLPQIVEQSVFVRQMGYAAGLTAAFGAGDHAAARDSLVDLYAEPRRSALIKGFHEAKAGALAAGALGCSISGAGPALFAVSEAEAVARRAGEAMIAGFAPAEAVAHVGKIATKGARPL